MDQEPMSRLIRSLHKLAQPPESDRLGDDQLLERFVAGRDRAAFELLLWRHGPMVLGVCRRVLPAAHDAEDAFQATWLTFVKKAGSIVHRAAVGSWLYQVAYRVALRARAARMKRGERESLDLDRLAVAFAGDLVETGELAQVLDEEVNRLPARQRAAFVLCCLEGRTGEEAARELGCAPGTVSSRLTRARERLRQRLIRRGLAPAAALTGAVAGDAWASPVSVPLADNTLKATLLFSSGKAAGGALSSQAVLLAEGVLRAMFVTKMKIAAALILAVGVFAVGGVLVHRTLTAAPQAKEQPAPPSQPAPKVKAAPAAAPRQVPKELLEKQLDVARKVFQTTLNRIRSGQGLPIELYGWSERWLESELALSSKKADRLAALKAHVERTRDVERMAVKYAATGLGRQEDADAATYYRARAEIRYIQATGEMPPPQKENKEDKQPSRPRKENKKDKQQATGEPLPPPQPRNEDREDNQP
jgi:RNA polymerase sigma factor (sigma-70 family)